MRYQISLREVNQNFARYIKIVEIGNEIIITRHGQPVARIVGISSKKSLTQAQIDARKRVLKMMKEGLSLGNQRFKRDDLYDR